MIQNNKETYWSQFAQEFEEKQSFVAGKEIISLTLDELLKEQQLGYVLELGCGTGLYTEALQKNAEKILATDFSDEMLKVAVQKRSKLQKVTFQKADALNLEFEENSFDTVFMANLIHIIGDAEKLIRESKRVLKEGGQLIITSFAIDEMNFFKKLSLAIRYLKTFGKPSKEANKEQTSRKDIEVLLKKYGFEISKSIILGKTAKAFYINCIKNN